MDKCKYYLKEDGTTLVFNSDAELTEFVKTNILSDSGTSVKYSKVTSGPKSKAEIILHEINKNNINISANIDSFMKEEEFLKTPHNINGKEELLVASVVKENYLESGPKELIKEIPELKELAKTDRELALKQAREIIESELELDEKMKGISTGTQYIMNSLIKNGTITDSMIEYVLKAIAEYNGEEYTPELFKNDIAAFKNKFLTWHQYKIKNSSHLFLSKMYLNKQTPLFSYSGISSPVSYLSVDQNGVPNIYDVRVTRTSFDDWHSAKILRSDYRLGINRQILEDFLPGDIDTNLMSLYTLPIVFPVKENGKIDLKNFHIEDYQERSSGSAPRSTGLHPSGKITETLKKLLPNKIKANLSESNKLSDLNTEMLKKLFGEYNFRTKLLRVSAEKKANEIIESSKKSSKLVIYDTLTKKTIEHPNTEEGKVKFKEAVSEYYERFNANKHSAITDIVKHIKEAKGSEIKDKRFIRIKGNDSSSFQNIFRKYLDPEWELVDNRPELLNAGVLLFKNNHTLALEAVSLTINLLDQVNNLGLGTTVLGKFHKDSELRSDKRIYEATTSHIEALKALLVLNNSKEILKDYSLKKLNIYDLGANKAD
jgi:hypothetical protein